MPRTIRGDWKNGIDWDKNEWAVYMGLCLLDTRGTIRSLAQSLHIPKSTVHKYLKHLATADPVVYSKVSEVLSYNHSVRHIRGGEATKKSWREGKRLVRSH